MPRRIKAAITTTGTTTPIMILAVVDRPPLPPLDEAAAELDADVDADEVADAVVDELELLGRRSLACHAIWTDVAWKAV